MKKYLPLLAGTFLVLGAATAGAQTEPSGTTPPGATGTGPTGAGIPNSSPAEQQPGQGASSLTQTDRRFAQQAMEGNVAEVQAGNLALQRATDPAVKAYAQRMVDDHSTAVQQLGSLLGGQGGDMPKAGSPEHQAELKQLMGLSGAKFDRAYMQSMVTDHDKTVRMYDEYASQANDSRLRLYITKTLQTVKEHQAEAQNLHQRLAKSE
jgi:putative membrane protein